MLHLVAFSVEDQRAMEQLQAQLSDADALILCESALDWPADHPCLKNRQYLFLFADKHSDPRLGEWLAEHPQSLYWAPSSLTTSSSG